MKNFSYITQGVCSKSINFDIENDKIYNVKFEGGCMGNLQAVAKLVEGKNAKEIAQILQGNDGRGKGTSCADQLAKAIDQALCEIEQKAC